jgi:thiol-disulfide isomerase/thioredoxin
MMRRALSSLIILIVIASCTSRSGKIGTGEFPSNWTWDDDPAHRAAHEQIEGKPMPPVEVTGWMNGEVTPADMKGKVVVLDFYATWCGPCMAAIPHNNELLAKYKDKGLVLAGVCTSDSGQEEMPKVVGEHGLQYPTARDPGEKTATAWKVFYFPTYAIVDRKGIVRIVGLTPDHVEEVVVKLLAEK